MPMEQIPAGSPPPTPSTPSEPTGGSDFSLDEFKAAVAASKAAESKPAETPPAATPPIEDEAELGEVPEIPLGEETEETPPAETPPAKPAEAPVKPAEVPDPATGKVPRSLEGIPPELHKHMRNMANEAFGALHNIIRGFYQQKDQIRELEVKAQEASNGALADLDNAYTLTPEFQQAQQVSASLDTELEHWNEQIIKCQANENWINVIQGPDGKPVEQETQPGPKALRYLMGKRQEALENASRVDQYMKGLQAQHMEANRNVKTWVQGMNQKLFANVKHDFSKDPMYTKLIAPLPPALKGQEIYQIAAKLAILLYRTSLNQKKAAANTQFSKTLEAAQGPTTVSATAAPAEDDKNKRIATSFDKIGY